MSNLAAIPPGLVHGLEDSSAALRLTAAVFLALALFNCLELIVLVSWTFTQKRGLYFWTLLISAVGIIPYVVGSILHYWNVVPLSASLTVAYVGFLAIVPIQSLVLYSRLYLVLYHEVFLRVLLDGIIIVSLVLLIPNTITMFGSAFITSAKWNYAYAITERLQVTGFCIQELFLSLLYIVSTVRLLRFSIEGKSRATKIMYELIGINLFTIALDIAVIAVEYCNWYALQVCLKVLVYSIKAKLEFAVLGRLVSVSEGGRVKRGERNRRSEFIGSEGVGVQEGLRLDDLVGESPNRGRGRERQASSVTAVESSDPHGIGLEVDLNTGEGVGTPEVCSRRVSDVP